MNHKTFYTHNTKLVETPGWDTTDKRGSVVIRDSKNNFMFQIDFGKRPRIKAFRTLPNGDIDELVFEGWTEFVYSLRKLKKYT